MNTHNTSTARIDAIADSMYQDAGMYTQAATVSQLARERDAMLAALRTARPILNAACSTRDGYAALALRMVDAAIASAEASK